MHLPKIVPCFDPGSEHSLHVESVSNALQKILPQDLFSEKITANEKEQFQLLLPMIVAKFPQKAPGKISFLFLAKYRSSSFNFFFEMISQWITSGKRLNVTFIMMADFLMPEVSVEVYTLCEIVARLEEVEELHQILTQFPIIESEIKLGLESSYYARRILEVKGLAHDTKTATIYEHMTHLTRRLPQVFGHDILAEMQHFQVICREEFKSARTSRHLSRIISIQYLFRKVLRNAIKEAPEQRYITLKIFKSQVNLAKGQKDTLSIIVGINFLRDKELLEKKQLLKVIQSHIPEAYPVENSYFVDRRGVESISTLYLEIEKSDSTEFSPDEILLLRHVLPKDLKENVEHLMYPVFMPCNEEEVMRNILSLSNEIRYVRDLPQVVITFDEQTDSKLSFTVIMVRILLDGQPSIQEILLKKQNPILECIYDRSKIVGTLRKKYNKEASVFRVNLPKDRFLRRDHSLDLYKARHTLVKELLVLFGEFRDFNGGMLTKQNDLLNEVKELLGDGTKYNDILLDNFFFSLMPVTMRSLLEPEALKILFLMLINAIEYGFGAERCYRIRQDLDFIFILIRIDHSLQKEELHKTFQKFNLHSTELAYFGIKVHQIPYEGCIYRCDEPSKQQQFLQAVQEAVLQKSNKGRQILQSITS